MKLHTIAFIILVIGGLNWLLVAALGQDIGSYLLGGMDSTWSKIIYALVGLSALYEIFTHKLNCKNCAPRGMGQTSSM